jgi:hypothetical protein
MNCHPERRAQREVEGPVVAFLFAPPMNCHPERRAQREVEGPVVAFLFAPPMNCHPERRAQREVEGPVVAFLFAPPMNCHPERRAQREVEGPVVAFLFAPPMNCHPERRAQREVEGPAVAFRFAPQELSSRAKRFSAEPTDLLLSFVLHQVASGIPRTNSAHNPFSSTHRNGCPILRLPSVEGWDTTNANRRALYQGTTSVVPISSQQNEMSGL